ncbi:MAG TPA: flagellar basal body L-ring protein FlgH [Dongiaceae bacterium]|jgi:flagellar L-ring protein precursor FlgH|nr:flagellar basal body L-ring protein FlgH [Dongiaceae bacterium]
MPSKVMILFLCVACGGCGVFERLSRIGQPPSLSSIENPTAQPGYVPVSLPMPAPIKDIRQPASLWRQGSRAFFRDQRAGRVGDVLTVTINIDDQAQLQNATNRGRNASEDASVSSLFGIQAQLAQILSKAGDPTSLAKANSDSLTKNSGAIGRKEQITLRVAALITQVLPNGNFVLQGRQEVRVNSELRELQVMGVIRPEDISSLNDVPYDKIAEARIAYGGRGTISDVQQPRYGQELYDILFPF